MYSGKHNATHEEDVDVDKMMELYVPVEELEIYDEIAGWLKEVIRHIFETGNVEGMLNALEEAGAPLGIGLPNDKPKIKGETL